MENIGLGAGLAALAFWGFVGTCVIATTWASIRKRDAQHETVRRLIESGQSVDEELMRKLSLMDDGVNEHADRDFFITGLWLLPLSVGMVIFAVFLGTVEPDTLPILLGVAGLLACMGFGALLAARIVRRWYPENDTETGQH